MGESEWEKGGRGVGRPTSADKSGRRGEMEREGWEAGRVLSKGNIGYGWAQVVL